MTGRLLVPVDAYLLLERDGKLLMLRRAPGAAYAAGLLCPRRGDAGLDLWLLIRLDNALMRMNARPPAVAGGQVTPVFGWGSMATVRGSDLAYLTTRPAPHAPDGSKLYEVGVVGLRGRVRQGRSGQLPRRTPGGAPRQPASTGPGPGDVASAVVRDLPSPT